MLFAKWIYFRVSNHRVIYYVNSFVYGNNKNSKCTSNGFFFFKLLLFWHHLIHFWPFIKFWATLILFDPLQSNLTHRVHYCFWLICQLKLWQCFVGYRGSLHFVISQFVIPAMILFWAFLKNENQKNYHFILFLDFPC